MSRERPDRSGLGMVRSVSVGARSPGLSVRTRPSGRVTTSVNQAELSVAVQTDRDGPATVLVVDDDDRLVSSVRRVLAYEGYRVLTARSGPEGLQLARDESPDLIILDVMLPGLDGLEIARRVTAAGGVPVLMLSARDQIEDKVAGLEAGADDYLVKPFAIRLHRHAQLRLIH
jgi:CheY-like chemotaxis protein